MRPRIDKTYPFKRVPDKPSDAFPDQTERWLPHLYVGLSTKAGKQFWTPALLDTGAAITLFGTQWADALGIDWKSCPTMKFFGIGNLNNTGYAADITMNIPSTQYSWPLRVVFSPAMDGLAYPLLGYAGFFDRFTVTFRPRSFRLFLQE